MWVVVVVIVVFCFIVTLVQILSILKGELATFPVRTWWRRAQQWASIELASALASLGTLLAVVPLLLGPVGMLECDASVVLSLWSRWKAHT